MKNMYQVAKSLIFNCQCFAWKEYRIITTLSLQTLADKKLAS